MFHTLKIILKQYKISREKREIDQTSVKRGGGIPTLIKHQTISRLFFEGFPYMKFVSSEVAWLHTCNLVRNKYHVTTMATKKFHSYCWGNGVSKCADTENQTNSQTLYWADCNPAIDDDLSISRSAVGSDNIIQEANTFFSR